MPLSLKQVFAQAGKEAKVSLVQDGPVFYLVLNTKLNMIDFEFIELCDKYLQ